MKLKLIKSPHLGQKEMVCNTNHGTYAVDLGGTVEVNDQAGHEILGKWGACFQQVLQSESKPMAVSTKVIEAEASPEAEAALEATKVVKNYAKKG